MLLNGHRENGKRSSLSEETFIGCLLCYKPWELKSEQNGQSGLYLSLGRGGSHSAGGTGHIGVF